MANIENLVRTIRGLETEEEAKYHLSKHINTLAEKLVKNSWRRAMHLMRFSNNNKKRQLKKFTLEADPYTDTVSVVDFVRVISAIQLELEECAKRNTSKEAMDITDSIETRILSILGGINIDKRTILPFDKL